MKKKRFIFKRKVNHTTLTKQICPICKKPFVYYWYDAEEINGHSETMYGIGECHKECLEQQTGQKIKTLHELNEERKNLK